jgi:hypothetical protein
MAIAFDGTRVPDELPRMACGGTPHFDHASGYAYRCDTCNAVIGSIGQPKSCAEINATEQELRQLVKNPNWKEGG